MTTSFTLPKWFDAHTHLRQGDLIAPIMKSQLDMGCYAVLAMPNTQPPVAKITESDPIESWSIEGYRAMIAGAGGDQLDHLVTPLYITPDTDAAMIEKGAQSGLLKAAKYYPPHGTTNSDHGLPMEKLMQSDVLQAMSDNNVTLCIHGEEHGLCPEAYFNRTSNAEEYFYRTRMPKLRTAYPDLKIACEHITTKVAVDFVKSAGALTGASVTPQHLLYTVGHLIQGLKYHLFCLPIVKFDDDREALRAAVVLSGRSSAVLKNFSLGVEPGVLSLCVEEGADVFLIERGQTHFDTLANLIGCKLNVHRL
ncbi:MAG: hypothetical protein COB76_05380 [Alphaproteobacteria bacterium]|nr:MAG: hypothetical protein COB76_05380 [Alphaproteobacteria bacterium]